ncbi:hypothetical protein N7X58_02045 [Leuconostoc mesenteroides]|uniref:hypothetical protein n=1 Tax=Leuconostoc mesenteroides TaxID=1245 RepID=UPI00205C0114|nr:hypothetical protein [Leuconostoc mesenteroides]MCU4664277.1 hypothetical protein [Leuconostoc mesenteroides]DAL96620.1 MAG TPA: hypothetical protein [Caudoviricetes sp.]
MKFLGLEIGSWSDLISAFATFLATAFALYLSVKKPKEVMFGFLTGSVFNHDEHYRKWSITNITHTFRENTVTISLLNVNVVNIGLMRKPIFESGIIVKGDFRKNKFGNYVSNDLYPNTFNLIDFGNNPNGLGHIVSLKSYKLNPFISNRKISFRVYVKDSAGKIYKSETFKVDDFKPESA